LYNLSHFSLGADLRNLTSLHPTGPAARIKPTLTADELATFAENVTANTLAPLHLTPKYVKERLFGVGAAACDVRVLVDGFPRDAAR
jgi:UMP-CMP kinase